MIASILAPALTGSRPTSANTPRSPAPRSAHGVACVATLAAAAAAVISLVLRSPALGLFFGAVAAAAAVAWERQHRTDTESKLGLQGAIEDAHALLTQGHYFDALSTASEVGRRARCAVTARRAWEIQAWAYLGLGRARQAEEALAAARPIEHVDLYLFAAVHAARGRAQIAVKSLELLRAGGNVCQQAVELLIELYAQEGRFDRACAVARAELKVIGLDGANRVVAAALACGALGPASELSEALCAEASSDPATVHEVAHERTGEGGSAQGLPLQAPLGLKRRAR